jgi:competence ComEA-like helix-hairpin-helix protein
MAIIPLRQYNREIEGLIDTGQLDEAVAHCRHILESFPKHIATYRLLGKAYLEQQRFGDAADIFQRVLSSVPDDHVANIGLSIIREDEGNLDAAIWYMERALEAQPSNAAIKDELRRLYGRRDGIEPPKVRLTRGALARMYSRGGLYDQAIAELRSALADDPQRPDLMVLLAQMYFYLGQQVEAVDTCGNIMKRLPYCLVANRILASILPQTGRADDTKTYHQRAIAMDPYFASAPANSLSADSMPESAINIERLAYRPGQAAGGSVQPAWATSLGIAFEESQPDQLPEWLQDQSSLETAPKQGIESVPTAPFSWETPEDEKTPLDETATFEDIIPEWMKEAGWQPAIGAAAQEQVQSELEFPSEQPEGEIAKADIPDWLKGLAPSGALDEEPSPDQSGPEDLDLPWLQKTTPGASDTIVNWLGSQKQAAQPPTEPEASPQTEIDLPGESAEKSAVAGAAVPGEEGGLPDWLQGVESSYGRSGITDWLKTSRVEEFEAQKESTAEEPAQPAEDLPDWLKEMGGPAAELTHAVPVTEEPVLPAEELPDWLKEMREPAEELSLEEPTAEEPALPAEELPDWLKGMGETATELAPVELTAEEPAIPSEELPDWLKGMGEPAAELTPVDEISEEPELPAGQLPGWLQEIGEPAAELTLAEPAIEEPALPAVELPEWLQEISEPTAELTPSEPTAEEPALPAEQLPDWLKEMGEPSAELAPAEPTVEEPALPVEELPDWIEEISEPAAAIESLAPEVEEPIPPFEDIPYWLKETAKITPAELSVLPVEPTPEEPTSPEIVLPGWLLDIGQTVPPTVEAAPIGSVDESIAQESALPVEELPDWLKEMGEPAAESPTPFSDQADQDAALAWLEALAAKHGAQEEELITKPEERQETIPDWIKQEAEEIQPPTPFIDQSDQDAALAWLEKLAAQHGAKEEELITRPEERSETIPDWVKLGAEEALHEEQLPIPPAEIEEPALPAEELPEWLKVMAEPSAEPAPVEVTPAEPGTEIPAASIDLTDQDAALAWLESLAVQHGAREEELITRPEERLETMPEWIKQEAEISLAAEEAPTQPVPVEGSVSVIPEIEEPALQAEQLPEILKEMAEPVLDLTPSEEPALPEVELPEWLTGTVIPTEASALPEEQAEPEQLPDWLKETVAPELELPGEKLAGDIEELPDWLKEVDAFAADETGAIPSAELPAAPAWMPEAILPETELPTPPAYVPLEQPTPLEIQAELPELEPEPLSGELLPELVNINTASLSQFEQLPGIGFVTAQNIIAYRETSGPFGTVDDLAQVTGIEPALIEELSPLITTGIPEPVLEAEPVVETEETIFTGARQAVEQGNVSHASDLYNRLIAQGADLEQVIADMQIALYRYPLDINFWQILGDAYLRTDKLQEALDAYTEAEELLR